MDAQMTASRIEDMPQLMSTRQAARVCGVTPRQIARMCERGDLKAARVGKLWRVDHDALAKRMGLK